MFWKKHQREAKQGDSAQARDDDISQPSEVTAWFTQQVTQYHADVAKQITRMTHDEQQTQEIMQEAYQRLWAKMQSYSDPLKQVRNFKGLLFTTAKNIFIDEFRKKKHEPQIAFIHSAEWDDHYTKEGSQYDEPEVACEYKEAQGEIWYQPCTSIPYYSEIRGGPAVYATGPLTP